MGKAYFKIMFSIFWAALAICGVLQIVMKIFFIDAETGFYMSSAGVMPPVFNIVFGLALVLMLIINRLRRGTNDYTVRRQCTALALLSMVTGVCILLFTWLGMPDHFGQASIRGQQWLNLIIVINIIFGALAGLTLIYCGLISFFSQKQPNAFLLIILPIWQIVLLLSRFNGYFSILYISDNLLIILFMLFATLFYIGHARTLSDFIRKDGRNYVISAGLGASLCGFLASVPNLIYMVVNRTAIPVTELGFFECLYTLALSVYAYAFVISYFRSIEIV